MAMLSLPAHPLGWALLVLSLSVILAWNRLLLSSYLSTRLLGGQCYMPRGPRGLPIAGSLLSWLHARNRGRLVPWLQEQARYGEMVTLIMGTKTWVLLNSERVLHEIMAKRAGITHERPYFPVAGGLVSRDHRPFLQKTDQWREARRVLHQLMTGEGSKCHGDLVEEASLGLLQAYLDEPEAWYAHHYRYALAIMYKIITDTTLQASRDELQDLQRVTSTFLTSINSSWVDFFPALVLLPKCLQFWRPHWENMGRFHYGVFKHWWSRMQATRAPESSFLRQILLGEFAENEDRAMYLGMFLLSAGSDNPRMTTNAFIMACLAYPEAIQHMRRELDDLCGVDALRLPGLGDLTRAPYTCAAVKEVLRWRPTVPLMPQRVLVEDLDFEGYRFAAGTEFIVNTISVCHQGFEDAASFKPERWLEDRDGEHDVNSAGIQQNLWQFAFNAGRRSCVGYKLAQKELFVVFSRLVYCFDFSPSGAYDDAELNAFAPGEPFPVRITVRSAAHESLIRNEAVKCNIWGS